MTTVYAPFNGNIWNLDTYCAGGTHTNVYGLWGSRPADLFAGQGTAVRLWVSTNVKSVNIQRCDCVCRTDPSPWDDGINVAMFSGYNCTGSNLGTVAFGHLNNRHSNGYHNSPNGRIMGYLPADCACGCSSGIHCHIECSLPRAYTNNCSWEFLWGNGTALYRD